MTDPFAIRFFGAFAIFSPAGQNITPKGSKAKGLLALLAEADDMRRGRRWLEAQLWSDRSQEQASGSLRQTLTEIRNALGEHSDLLGADRLEVWLDQSRIVTDLEREPDAPPHEREFLEGLEIRDEAFNDWLRVLRSRYPQDVEFATPVQIPGATRGLTIRSSMNTAEAGSESLAGRIIADQVAKTLEERLSALRFATLQRKRAGDVADLEIRCDVAEDAGRSLVFLRIESGHDGQVVFSGYRSVPGKPSDAISAETIAGLVHSAASKIVHRLPAMLDLKRPEAAALGYSSLGMRKLTRFELRGLEEAQSYFAKAYEIDSNGVYLAWRAFVRMAQLIEGAEGDQQARLDEVHQLTADSLQTATDNGLAVALVALTRIMLEDDLTAPASLAEKAVQWNSNNLFARQTLAVAHSTVGNTAQAYRMSRALRTSSPDDELGHLWDLYHALVCISSGHLDEAREAAKRASEAAPAFVAPRRQLVALCAHAGDMEAAQRYLKELRQLESGFTLDRFLNDHDYPVLTLRKAGLIGPLRKSPLNE